MRKLTLIRHGLTDWNSNGKFQGQTDVPLSKEGKKQAQLLAKYLKEPVNKVYSSPLARAYETAKIAFPGQEIYTDDRLKEIHFGVFEGKTQAENALTSEWEHWYADPFKRKAPSGESYEELRERMVAWMQDLEKVEHTVAVTHSGAIQMLVSHIIGVEYPRWRKRFYLRPTGVTRIFLSDGEAIIGCINDSCHLKTPQVSEQEVLSS